MDSPSGHDIKLSKPSGNCVFKTVLQVDVRILFLLHGGCTGLQTLYTHADCKETFKSFRAAQILKNGLEQCNKPLQQIAVMFHVNCVDWTGH